MAAQTLPSQPVPDDKVFKRWLGVLIALVTFIVSITTALHADASNRSAVCSRRAQENAVQSTAQRTRGQLQVAFANSVVRTHDELTGQALILLNRDRVFEAAAFTLAAQEIAGSSELLAPPYSKLDDVGWRQSTRTRQYEADTWVVTATLSTERRQAASLEGGSWSAKGNNYVAAIVVFALALFLFALAATVGGRVRRIFVSVGAGLTSVTFLAVLVTAVWPVPQIPDAALQQFAAGAGYTWSGSYANAVQAYSLAIKIAPMYAHALAQRGAARLELDPPDAAAAIQDLEAANRLAHDDANVLANLGWAYFLDSNYAQSVTLSRQAVALDSQEAGPAFVLALAYLALGQTSQAEQAYQAALDLCFKIQKQSLDAGLAAPYSLWDQMVRATTDLENLLSATHSRYCYADRAQLNGSKIADRAAILRLGEQYRTRIKEVHTALEYQHVVTVTPTGARFTPLEFGNKVEDENERFRSYVVRDRFPHTGETIYALWNYAGVKPSIQTVWKIYRDGTELPELRYASQWGLGSTGGAEKKLNSWFILEPGRYDAEVYGDGELLATGTFQIDEKDDLPVAAPGDIRPEGVINVGNLILYDDFANNNHGWWTGFDHADGTVAQEAVLRDGEYRLLGHTPNAPWRVTCDQCGDLGDGYYQVSARSIRGPKDRGYRLTVRASLSADQAYLFLISANGEFTVGKSTNGRYTTLTAWTPSGAIDTGQTNRIGVLAQGSSFEFYVNGRSVARVSDALYSSGHLGVTVEAPDLEVAFSQLRFWEVP